LGLRPYPRSRGIALAATFAALISVFSPVSVPIGPVPITLQVFIVYLALALLGPLYGTLSMLIYLFLGLVGLPVFAGFGSGSAVLLGPTGGYLFAYPLAGLFGGLIARGRASTRGRDTTKVALGCLAGIALIYTLGAAWLSLFIGAEPAIAGGVVPFVPIDLLKAVVAVPLAVGLRWSPLQLPINFSIGVPAVSA
jgi:biotin transport system substrate-specific component